MNRIPGCSILSIVTLTIAVISNGCGGKSIERYNPAKTSAKQAIEKALTAWKSGEKLDTIAGPPAINTFDARWQAGAKLESFSVLEEVPEQEHPQFKVKIKLVGKPEEVAEYLVIGIDPLLVFRKEDYKKASGL